MKTIGVTLLVVAASASVGSGAPFRTDINPALLYYQAFTLAPDLPQADRDYLFTNEWRSQKLPERFGQLLAQYDNEFRLIRQAAQAKVPCDWGIDMTPGPAALLPALARSKAVAQTARLRALWDLQNGRQAEARDDLLAAFALGRNVSRDGTLISVLVQIAMENILCSIVAENFHQFSPGTLKQLADGFDAAPSRGTVAASIPTEKRLFRDWLLGRILELQKENPGNDAKVMAGIRDLIAGMEGTEEGQPNPAQANQRWEQLAKAAGGKSAGIVKLLSELEPLYQRLAAILSLPPREFEGRMKEFSAEIQSSANPFVTLVISSAWEKSRVKELALLVELAMVRAGVEYKLHGEPGLKTVSDPCGHGPFAFRRFVFDGVDRGFELKSSYEGRGFPEVLIFIEKDGPPFRVNWKNAGQAIPK